MKILSVEKIREADAYTIKHEPIPSIELMERAAFQLYRWIRKRVDKEHTIQIFAGIGNNGGDGLVLARLLLRKGYQVKINIVRYANKTSADFQTNCDRLLDLEMSLIINEINSKQDLPQLSDDDLLVDALFGSGLARPAKGIAAEAIALINHSSAVTIAIDIPSGLYADSHSDPKDGEVVRADYTLSFQMPKMAFMLPENDRFVGEWHILDIGLSSDYINASETKAYFMMKRDISPMIRQRRKFDHKGTFGHALLIAGSYGKMGAAILASRACLRSGVGLLHAHIPKVGYEIIQTASPETMLSIDRYDNYFSEVPELAAYNAVGIGPGLGIEKQSQMALKLLIQNYPAPIVFDADALNILAENKTWLPFLPANSVLTPHPKEFERLAGKWSNDYHKLQLLREFCAKFNVHVVLKGAHTASCFPNGNIYFNSTGNPGMATAGSGDVLTGLILGLLAQGYSAGQSAVIGVYLHGLAGDIGMKKRGVEAIVGGDIIEEIGSAYKKLNG